MSTIVFFHVPRTAGTSFRLFAEKILGKDKILPIYGGDILKAVEVIQNADLNKYELIRGHITTRCRQVMPDDTRYMTILRNPVDRVASLYRYIRKDGRHPIHREVSNMNLVQFVQSGVSLETNNGMCRQLCGQEPELPQSTNFKGHTPFMHCDATMLANAWQELDRMQVVGVMEYLEETLQKIDKEFGWVGELPHANRTRPGTVSPTVRKIVGHYNRLDMKLWASAAKELLGRRP